MSDRRPVRAGMRYIFALFYAAAAYIHLTMPSMFMPVMPDWITSSVGSTKDLKPESRSLSKCTI